MKVLFKSLVALGATYFLASGLVLADPASVSISTGSCYLADDVDIAIDIRGYIFVEGDRRQVVSANNDNGNISYSCSVELDRTESGRSVMFSIDNTGFPCEVNGESTDDWHEVISASGKAKLTCHFKG